MSKLQTPIYMQIVNRRVKIADDTPIAFINNYLLPNKVPNLEEKVQILQHIGLYRLLEKEYHLKLHSAVKTISVYLSGPLDIKIFNIPKNRPLFLTNRITYLDNGTIFESATSIIRADKNEFTVYLKGRPLQRAVIQEYNIYTKENNDGIRIAPCLCQRI